MITTVSEQVEGKGVVEVIGVVFGTGITNPPGVGKDSPLEMMGKAVGIMESQAGKAGANAVVGVRLDARPLGNSSLMLAYGTAVKLADA